MAWNYSKDSTVKVKSFKAAISYFKRLHTETKGYMDQLVESLENMPIFYPTGLHANMSEPSGIIYDESQYIEWNKGVYAMGIEWLDEEHVYLYLNSNEILKGGEFSDI